MSWTWKAFQLDLARQRETVPVVCDLIRQAPSWGYNAVMLYLEGVVRTEHFPYRPADQSYSEADVKQMVEAAKQAGVTLIPATQTLGHMEHFLTCPELKHLAAPEVGFGSNTIDVTKPESYVFIENYLSDLVKLFPSPMIHVGTDEAFMLSAFAVRSGGKFTFADLLIGHLLKVHAIVKRLGRQMWMWSDLLEYVDEEQIVRLPRDIVMTIWEYGREAIDHDGTLGHFDGRIRRDWLGLFHRLGFSSLVCPCANYGSGSADAWTRVGQRPGVIGGINTVWELGSTFMPRILLGVAVTGRRWSQPREPESQSVETALSELLPSLTPVLRNVVWESHNLESTGSSAAGHIEPTDDAEHRIARQQAMLLPLMEQAKQMARQPREKDIVEDAATMLKRVHLR
ncbi:MAG: family 20 glycosylhydrolase, partial [Phycisphaeraceae bacterium]|nr:family 20 glycosylhydrolase [Phycisphaeraceae bacterium]